MCLKMNNFLSIYIKVQFMEKVSLYYRKKQVRNPKTSSYLIKKLKSICYPIFESYTLLVFLLFKITLIIKLKSYILNQCVMLIFD